LHCHNQVTYTAIPPPNGFNQINDVFPIKGLFENVFIGLIIRVLLEKAVGPVTGDVHADLIREFYIGPAFDRAGAPGGSRSLRE
jgi:hypothetical protein